MSPIKEREGFSIRKEGLSKVGINAESSCRHTVTMDVDVEFPAPAEMKVKPFSSINGNFVDYLHALPKPVAEMIRNCILSTLESAIDRAIKFGPYDPEVTGSGKPS